MERFAALAVIALGLFGVVCQAQTSPFVGSWQVQTDSALTCSPTSCVCCPSGDLVISQSQNESDSDSFVLTVSYAVTPARCLGLSSATLYPRGISKNTVSSVRSIAFVEPMLHNSQLATLSADGNQISVKNKDFPECSSSFVRSGAAQLVSMSLTIISIIALSL